VAGFGQPLDLQIVVERRQPLLRSLTSYLMLFYYTPHAAGLRIVVEVALCLVMASGLCLVAWRLRPLARWLLLILFFWLAPNVPMRADLVFYVGLLCWGLLCFVETGRRLPFHTLASRCSRPLARWQKSRFSSSLWPAWHWLPAMWPFAAAGGSHWG
jgi:hypothetical protein